jgi:hypothetical protein
VAKITINEKVKVDNALFFGLWFDLVFCAVAFAPIAGFGRFGWPHRLCGFATI